MNRTTLVTTLFSLTLACDAAESATNKAAPAAEPAAKAKAEAPPAKAAASKPVPPTEPAGPPAIVLEEADLPGLGKLKMPKGFTSKMDKHWSFDLGNYESIDVSWEPHGAADLKKATSLSNILATAETVKSAKTLDSGHHEIERVRASDGFTFIAVFGKDWYVKCVAPAAKIEVCREIVRSKA